MYRLKLLMLVIAAILFSQAAVAQAPAKQKAVLVTGASSGIGLEITKYLTARGFYVYATARKDDDLKRLEAMDNVSSLRLDVTKQAEVDAAVKFVSVQGRGLYGVVNNAGVASLTELAKAKDDDILWQYDINVMGPVRVNRAFYPMLKESKGRTAIIGSVSGSTVVPTGGAYAMTKFAAEAYTETLALELAKDDVKAGIISPGSFKSLAREKLTMQQLTGTPDLNQKVTEEQAKVLADVRESEGKRKEPVEVAEQVFHFLTSDTPRVHYLVAPERNTFNRVIRTTLGRSLQLNASQPAYSLSRDEIVKLVDEILAEQAAGKK